MLVHLEVESVSTVELRMAYSRQLSLHLNSSDSVISIN